jgi:hypothetical protein
MILFLYLKIMGSEYTGHEDVIYDVHDDTSGAVI